MAHEAAATNWKRPEDFPDFKCHNHLLGDHVALEAAWESDGYWFFKGVIDKHAIARVRQVCVEELTRLGVVDHVGNSPDDHGVYYNGASLENYPARMEPVAARAPFRKFIEEPSVQKFFTELLGDEPLWVPIDVYRATPPNGDPEARRMMVIHQDGPQMPGFPFRICWFPLVEITIDVGGLAVAEGMTDEIVLARPENNMAISRRDIPDDRWRYSNYEPGDLLMMNLWAPHVAFTNISDRFRLSVDSRVMAKSIKGRPLIGRISRMGESDLTIVDDGKEHTLLIGPDTIIRDQMANMTDTLSDFFEVGSDVIVAYKGDTATVVRPPSY